MLPDVMSDSHAYADTIAHAERVCADRGERLTPLRRHVLELVAKSDGPVKAYDLLDQMNTGPGAAKPPTVYRALDFLMRLGLIHRVEALKSFIACAHGHGHEESAELYICESCGRVDEQDHPDADPSPPSGFAVSRSVIEHYGQCGDCINDR